MTRPVLLLLALGLAFVPLARAELSVTSQIGAQKIGTEDQVQLTITVSGGNAEIPLPALTNLTVVGGPSDSQQISFVNGAISHSHSVTYALQADGPGHAEVGPIHVRSGSEEKTAPAIAVEVVEGSVRPQRAQRPANPFDPFGGEDPFEGFFGRRRQRGPDPKVFIEAVSSRTRVYVGEPVLVTYYVYTNVSVTDSRVTQAPKYPGFWSEDVPLPPSSPGGEPATVGGENFRRFPISQKLLFPTKAGTMSVPPLSIRLGLPGYQPIDRSTKPLTITAMAIPEEPGFAGAVGRFAVSATLDKTAVTLGDAATLRFEVRGNGNLKWVDRAPELSVRGAKIYPPQTKSELNTTTDGIMGTKAWEFIIVPETAGTLEIPALGFTYFDPAAGQITHAHTEPLALAVTGAASSAPAPGAAPMAAAGPGGPGHRLSLRSDLDPPRRLPIDPMRGLTLAFALVVAGHLALFGASWWRDGRRTAEGRPGPAGDVRRALSDLRKAGRDGMTKEASVALIERTLHQVFGALDDTALTPESPRERAARAVLQEVEFIRYAPQLGDYSEKIQEVARRAAEVVQRWA